MTVRQLLHDARRHLKAPRSCADPHTIHLDAVVLLAHCRRQSVERLYADMEDTVGASSARRFRRLIDRRTRGWPVAYLVGWQEFYGHPFRVDRRVLIPRPDSEVLVDATLQLLRSSGDLRRLHDCCTGCGILAITIALEATSTIDTDIRISASDTSASALRVAAINAEHLLGRQGVIDLFRADLLQGMSEPIDLLISNPPYLTTRETKTFRRSAGAEPRLALDGGADGLRFIRRLARESLEIVRPNGYLLVEGADTQAQAIRALLIEYGYLIVRQMRDLGGRLRVTVAQRQT